MWLVGPVDAPGLRQQVDRRIKPCIGVSQKRPTIFSVMTTANKITVARILLIPVFVTLAIYYGESIQRGEPLEWLRFSAIVVFLVAAASDGLDGYVARRYNQRSPL